MVTFVNDSKLSRAQNLVCEDLIHRADVLIHTHTHINSTQHTTGVYFINYTFSSLELMLTALSLSDSLSVIRTFTQKEDHLISTY